MSTIITHTIHIIIKVDEKPDKNASCFTSTRAGDLSPVTELCACGGDGG